MAKALSAEHFGIIKAASRMCVCALVNIDGLTSLKETVFCNFDFAYLPCRLHPLIFLVTRRITRKAGYSYLKIVFPTKFKKMIIFSVLTNYIFRLGDRGSTVVKVLCYNSEGRWFDPGWCQWNFSLT